MGLLATAKENDEAIILGSLVSRVETGMHVPESHFERGVSRISRFILLCTVLDK